MKRKFEFKNRLCGQFKHLLAVQVGVPLLCLVAASSPAQTYTVLHKFTGSDGANPIGRIAVSGTTLYGATEYGGISNRGTIFKINTDGSNFALLHNFILSDGAQPNGVEMAPFGTTLYGTTMLGGATNYYYTYGAGTIFKVNVDGSGYAVLHSFGAVSDLSDGFLPQAGLLLSGETLYGTCSEYGGLIAFGTVFKINSDDTGYGHLWGFSNSADGHPNAELVSSGTTLYGTAAGGGNQGTIFKINNDGSGYSLLRQFPAPRGLVLSDATIYGMTTSGGASNSGTIFSLNTDGSGFTVLKSFTLADGASPKCLVLSGTNLYGTTSGGGVAGCGVLFQINTDGSGYQVLRQFRDDGKGVTPTTTFVFGTTLYGATSSGGLGNGVLFSLSLSPPTIITPPQSQTAEIGTTVNFQVDAGDDQSLACQWFLNSNALTEMTTYTHLSLTNVQLSQAGNYTVVLTNIFGVVTSPPAKLTVIGVAPNILSSPLSQTARLGATVNFSVEVDGSLPLTYQWFFNGTNVITGASDSVLRLTYIQPSQSGTCSVVVSNAFGIATSSPAILTVTPAAVVTSYTEAELRAAMAGGGLVTFARDGTITLGNTITIDTDTILDGSGHQIIISGGNVCRVFYNPDATLTLVNLTIVNGLSTNVNIGGGAISNGGTVNATNSVFAHNTAYGFSTNSLGYPPTSAGGDASGGAIYNAGVFNADSCSFLQNSIIGGMGTPTNGWGGQHPIGIGSPGARGGEGGGGAIFNVGQMTITRSLFASNIAVGGKGGTGESGWAGIGGMWTQPGGPGGNGGPGFGAALFNMGTADLANCTFAWNQSLGGNGGAGGPSASFTFEGHTYTSWPGPNGANGDGLGGIYNTNGSLNLTNCTVAFNSCSNGFAGGGGIATAGDCQLINTLLASNTLTNCSGGITDLGDNLSSDNSCAFSGSGSLNNTDPKLGPLTNNGGPTLTMRLLPGSPAIDAGDNTAAPPTDQRGFPRPVGLAADIGACECGPPAITESPPTQTAELNSTICLWVDTAGEPAMGYLWFCNGTDLIGSGTNCELNLTNCEFSRSGTYTIVVTNLYGAVSSTPFQLDIIPPVERRPVPGIRMLGDAGSMMHLDYATTLYPVPDWSALDSVTLTGTSELYFDLTKPLAPQRFYRVWQTGTPSVAPSLTLPAMIPAITLTGNIGDQLRLDYINQFGPTDAWVTLDTVTLTNTSQLYFDVSAPGQPARLWRIVPVP